MAAIRRLCASVLLAGLVVVGCGDGDRSAVSTAAPIEQSPSVAPSAETVTDQEASAPGTDNTVVVTVESLAGYGGGDLGGVLHRDSDALVLGGFAVEVDSDEFTTTQTMRHMDTSPNPPGLWPHVADEVLAVDPGKYTLTLWADTGLGGYNRWLPMNSDGAGLAGCVFSFEVGEEPKTEVVLKGELWTRGYLGVCEEAGTGPERGLAPSGDQWIADFEGIELTLTPELVDPTIGQVEVAVEGVATPGYSEVFVMACPGLEGNVNPASGLTADLGSLCAADAADLRGAGALVNVEVVNARFSATITVAIDSKAIEDGGVVVLAGDIFVPYAGTALVRVG